MSGQHRADSDTTWQRGIAVGPTLAHFFRASWADEQQSRDQVRVMTSLEIIIL